MISRRGENEPQVLSLAQEALWYVYQMAPQSPVYNVPFYCRLNGSLDASIFDKAVQLFVDRHAVLRTVFLLSKGAPAPHVIKKRRVETRQIDLRHVAEEHREKELGEIIKTESSRPFDLTRDVLFRPILVRLAENQWVFLHIAPHIVFEGGSILVLYRDLAVFYDALLSGREPDLPPLSFEYSDFAWWQRESLKGERLSALSAYWEKTLRGVGVGDVPTDFPRPAVHTQLGAQHSFAMSGQLIAAANEMFSKAGTTPYRGLFATFAVFLHSYSGSADFCVSSPFAPAWYPRVKDLVGYFVNTTAIRVDLSGAPNFLELLKGVNAALWGAMTHSDLPFLKVVEIVHPPRDPSRMPLTQVNFRAPRQPHPALRLNGISATPARLVDNGTAKFDLALEVESSNGQACYFEYCSDLFRESTIIQMESDFPALLRALIAHPEKPIVELSTFREIAMRVRRPNAAVMVG